VDRIVDLSDVPTEYIQKHGYDYLLEDDYLTPEAILLDRQEQVAFRLAAAQLFRMFQDQLDTLVKSNNLATLPVVWIMMKSNS